MVGVGLPRSVMAVRASKQAVADAADLLGKPRGVARDYLRGIQRQAGVAIPYTHIVEAMQEHEPTSREEIVRRALEIMERRNQSQS